ncbi:MAG: LPXTG cell wall anchor domain-containing protein [Planctomycetota bacterium]|nr:LPXTG cell wall anchor domain-containing protein [Planctomycetota bacterium]
MKKTVLLIGICLMIMSAHAQQTNEERYKQCVEHYYENKGPGFEKEIKEQCDLAEPDILKEIEEKLKEEKTSKIEYKVAYSSIDMWYSDLATCYKRAKDMEKSCSYCIKSNEYGKKSGSKVIYDCSNYGCPKDSSTSSNSLTNVTQTDGNSTIVYMAAAIVLLALIAGLFVLGRKKKEKK